jgi:hypothetical protein
MIGAKVIMILIVAKRKKERERKLEEIYCRDGAHIACLHVSLPFPSLLLFPPLFAIPLRPYLMMC